MAEIKPVTVEFDVYLVPRNHPDITCWADAEIHASGIGIVTVDLNTLAESQSPVERAIELIATRTPDVY